MRLDAHQHFWAYDEAQYPWIPKGSPLHRDWLPDDLAQEQAGTGFDGSIAVQARQTFEESQWLLTLADLHSRIKGVVGWADLRSDRVEDQLAALARHPKFVGVRHVVQDEPDDGFLLGREFRHGVAALASFGLTYDLLIHPRQLPAAVALTRAFPSQPFVLDHLAKPPIRDGLLSPWKEHMRELAESPNVFCKVSGLVTEARQPGWQTADFRPFLDTVFEVFGVERLMFGSDWPVCLLAASYPEVVAIVNEYTQPLAAADRVALFGANASQFYLQAREQLLNSRR